MSDFKENKRQLDKELEQFIALLNQLLPQYHSLLKKKNLDQDELKKLGEIEHYLIGVNSKIMEIKGKLEQDLLVSPWMFITNLKFKQQLEIHRLN